MPHKSLHKLRQRVHVKNTRGHFLCFLCLWELRQTWDKKKKKKEKNEKETKKKAGARPTWKRKYGGVLETLFSLLTVSHHFSLSLSLQFSLSFALSICSLSLPHHASLSFFLSIFIIQDTSPVFFACVRFMTTITHGSCKQGTLKRCIRCSYLKRVHPNGVGGRRGTKMQVSATFSQAALFLIFATIAKRIKPAT